jgi:nitroimidazol reductase NimA-like FMN-containing flavoprotein (pyridoxamine 5'-phosphate oxidase superfamily)
MRIFAARQRGAIIAREDPMTRTQAKSKPRNTNDPVAQRPYLPGYGVPANAKGLLPWRWGKKRLTESHNYWFITTKPDGAPHAVPIWGIWHDSVFYFSTGRQSRKVRNLTHDARCIVCNERAEEAVIVEGVAEEITDPKLIARLARPYGAKYEPWRLDPQRGPIFAVRPRMAFGMAEKTFDRSATRWRF